MSVASAVTTFDLEERHGDVSSDDEAVHSDYQKDLREIPEAPDDFTNEDRTLREVLVEFYLTFKAGNLGNIHAIVRKYRGRNVSHLWAALASKYNLPAPQVVDLLMRTIYLTVPFEYGDEEQALALESALEELRAPAVQAATGAADAMPTVAAAPPDRVELLRRAMDRGAGEGTVDALRVLAFRGIPDECGLRPQVWRVLLGYLPMARHSEWNAIRGEKHVLYASYKAELLAVSEDHKVDARQGAHQRPNELQECQDLLTEIKQDVERTRRDFEYFRRPATKGALIALLFIYARLNPGVRYVQGMNEVAAVILYVMSTEDDQSAETDAFWCFSELMVEIKENFMQALDDSGEGVTGLVGGVMRLLRVYDPELARHLQRVELPPLVFAFRWCTLLFAQDATLPDVVRLWDTLIADPRRFEFVIHSSLALLLENRKELLHTSKQFELAEVLQSAPRRSDFDLQMRRAFAICAFERREQTPPFPLKSALQVVDELSDWAKTAAEKAQEVGAEVSRGFQEHIAPVMAERASQASIAAEKAAVDGQKALNQWLEETAPARKEALEKAQTKMSTFWGSVCATAVATQAIASSKAQRLSSAAEGATSAASSVYAEASRQLGSAAAPPSSPGKRPGVGESLVGGVGQGAVATDECPPSSPATAAAVELSGPEGEEEPMAAAAAADTEQPTRVTSG